MLWEEGKILFLLYLNIEISLGLINLLTVLF
jgi:hypothetical protein